MNALSQLPVWLLFLALAFPLALIAWSARAASQSLSRETTEEPKTISEEPVRFHEDGTRSQTITVQVPTKRSVSITQSFGPIAISAHGRIWAANAIILGLLLVFIGMMGLFHFPSSFGPAYGSGTVEAYEDEEP